MDSILWQHEEIIKFWLTNSTCQSWKDQISDRCRKPSCRSSIGRDATSFRLCKLNRSSCPRKKPAPTWFHGCSRTNPRTETLPPFPGWQFTQCPIFITAYTQTPFSVSLCFPLFLSVHSLLCTKLYQCRKSWREDRDFDMGFGFSDLNPHWVAIFSMVSVTQALVWIWVFVYAIDSEGCLFWLGERGSCGLGYGSVVCWLTLYFFFLLRRRMRFL